MGRRSALTVGIPFCGIAMASYMEVLRRRQYAICQERGHKPSGYTLLSNPPWEICGWCKTKFRYETVLVERDAPVSGEDDECSES